MHVWPELSRQRVTQAVIASCMSASSRTTHADLPLVQRILDDLKDEPRDRMMAIRNEMMAVKDRKFWEVTDRGVDFFYIDDEQKKYVNQLYTQYIEPHYPRPTG